MYEGCSKNNVTCIGAHIAKYSPPARTHFLASQYIFGGIFHTIQWGHPSDTDKQQIQGHFSNSISFQINDI